MSVANKEKYNALNGVKAIACFMVIIIHMRGLNDYHIQGYFYNNFLLLSTYVVMLFMTISAFGLCCGYHKKILDNKVDLASFYKKRIQKILPFFGLLVIIDVISKHSMKALYEGFADLTLVFGFTNKELSVLGVGWFIGTIFVFYLIFPFFCVITKNKKSAWISFVIAVLWTIVSINYFDLGRMNILYSGSFFVAGALIYLYREKLEKINRWLWLGITIIICVTYYLYHPHKLMQILVVSAIIIYAIVLKNSKFTILNNKFMTFISSISLEIYLSHLFIFRIIQKLGLNTRFGNGVVQYIITVLLVIIGSIIFSFVISRVIKYAMEIIQKMIPKNGRQGSR